MCDQRPKDSGRVLFQRIWHKSRIWLSNSPLVASQRRHIFRQSQKAGYAYSGKVSRPPAAVTILPAGLARGYAANEKLDVALVGVGGRGRWFVDTIPRMENVAAVCDVSDQKLAAAQQHWKDAGESSA